ncbi:hypothetical protein Tco_1292672 [Tanacetum coccineum]
MDDETTADEQAYSNGEEVGRDHIPTVNLRQSWWKPLTEDRPASPEPARITIGIVNDKESLTLTPKDLEGPAYEFTMLASHFHLGVNEVILPSNLTSSSTKIWSIIDTVREMAKTALSISKMKAAFYQMLLRAIVPDTILDLKRSPRAVTFRDRYGVQMIMRFNEIHKFSDGTLQQIDDDSVGYQKPLSEAKEFMFAIQNGKDHGRIFQTWRALWVDGSEKATTDRPCNQLIRSYKDGKVRYSLPRSRQNWRDLPRDNSLVSVEVLRQESWNSVYAALTSPATHDPQRILFPFLKKYNTSLSSFSLELVDIEKVARTGKYGDFDGYTSDDLILILEILSRRSFKMNYLITGRPPGRRMIKRFKMDDDLKKLQMIALASGTNLKFTHECTRTSKIERIKDFGATDRRSMK